jgi:hypothetical protein
MNFSHISTMHPHMCSIILSHLFYQMFVIWFLNMYLQTCSLYLHLLSHTPCKNSYHFGLYRSAKLKNYKSCNLEVGSVQSLGLFIKKLCQANQIKISTLEVSSTNEQINYNNI